MTRAEFHRVFRRAIEAALSFADGELPQPAPRTVEVELHGAGNRGQVMTADDAADRLFIAPDRFYRIVDVGVKAVSRTRTTVFVRASDHALGTWQETWDPDGDGPFKQILPGRIQVADD
jgi:hypothetical protein